VVIDDYVYITHAGDIYNTFWSGELEGGTTTHNYWNTPSLKEMIDKALARAIESTFQDEGVRSAIANAIQ
jgi:hypothetical protein